MVFRPRKDASVTPGTFPVLKDGIKTSLLWGAIYDLVCSFEIAVGGMPMLQAPASFE